MALIAASAAIGVAGTGLAENYSDAGRHRLLSQLRILGSDLVVVTPRPLRNSRIRGASVATTLLPRDYESIRREVDDIEATAATSNGSYLVKAGDLSKSNCAVLGTEAAYSAIKNWPVAHGRYFGSDEDRRAARVAVLGTVVSQDLFGSDSPIGQRVFINRVPFTVIGVLQERGQDVDGGNADNTVYVPLSTHMHRLANVDYYNSIVLRVRQGGSMDRVTSAATRVLSRTHHSLGAEPVDFLVLNQRTLVETQLLAARRLGRYVAIVGSSALVLSLSGIFAVAWLGVTERRVEIGLRRAVGATRAAIFWQFLLESSVSSTVGCLLGLLVAATAAQSLRDLLFNGQPFSWSLADRMTCLSLLLSVAFSCLPAYRAAALDPSHALQSA